MGQRLRALLTCIAVAACGEEEQARPPAMPEGADFVTRAPKIAEEIRTNGVGALKWRGGVSLQWRNPAEGGYSGLVVSPDGRRLTAVGWSGWLQGRLSYDLDGALAAFEGLLQAPLKGGDGAPLIETDARDAEALAETPDGYLVGFETLNRVARYQSPEAAAVPFALPAALAAGVPDWGGFSSVAARADGRVVILTEGARDADGVRGWIEGEGLFWLDTGEEWLPVDLARLPGGDFALIEVGESRTGRFDRTRVSILKGGDLRGGAVLSAAEVALLEPPRYWEKIEAVAAREGPDGEALIYLMSDSRGSWPTDVMMFELTKTSP